MPSNPYLENAISKILEIRPEGVPLMRINPTAIETLTFNKYYAAIEEIRKGLSMIFPAAAQNFLVPGTNTLKPELVNKTYVVNGVSTYKSLTMTQMNPLITQLRAFSVGSGPPPTLTNNLLVTFWTVFFQSTIDITNFIVPGPTTIIDNTSTFSYSAIQGLYATPGPALAPPTRQWVSTFAPLPPDIGSQQIINTNTNEAFYLTELFMNKDETDGFEKYIRIMLYDFFKTSVLSTYVITITATATHIQTGNSSSVTIPSHLEIAK